MTAPKKVNTSRTTAPRKPTLEQIYVALNINSEKLQEGDRVKINFTEGYARFGCPYDASDELDNEGIVTCVNEFDVEIRSLVGESGDCYPFFAVSLLSRAEIVELNDEYTAIIDRDEYEVVVGCQRIPFESIFELYETIKQIRNKG